MNPNPSIERTCPGRPGLLTPEDAAILRAIKELRNLFAHRVHVDFLAPSVLKATTKLHMLWLNRTTELIKAGAINGTTGHLSVFTTYHAYFHRMHSRVTRLGCALAKIE